MKILLLRSHLAFLISMSIFSAIPVLVNGQASENDERRCNCRVRPVPFACGQICGWKVNSTGNDKPLISFTASNTISFQLPETQNVSARIYDITGRLVKILANSRMDAGAHQITWDGRDEKASKVGPGIYFLHFAGVNKSETRKFAIVS